MPQIAAWDLTASLEAASPTAQGLDYECNHPFLGHRVLLREPLQG